MDRLGRAARALLTAVFTSFALVTAGCAGSNNGLGGAGSGPSDGLSCGRRLIGGTWRFVGYTPDRPLDPPSRQNLERLHSALRLSFNGQQALTTGPGLQHVSAYRVDQDNGVSCRLWAADDAGVTSSSVVRFLDGNHLEVTDTRSPVPGRAVMERMGTGM